MRALFASVPNNLLSCDAALLGLLPALLIRTEFGMSHRKVSCENTGGILSFSLPDRFYRVSFTAP